MGEVGADDDEAEEAGEEEHPAFGRGFIEGSGERFDWGLEWEEEAEGGVPVGFRVGGHAPADGEEERGGEEGWERAAWAAGFDEPAEGGDEGRADEGPCEEFAVFSEDAAPRPWGGDEDGEDGPAGAFGDETPCGGWMPGALSHAGGMYREESGSQVPGGGKGERGKKSGHPAEE